MKYLFVLLVVATMHTCLAQSDDVKINLEQTVYTAGKTYLKKTGEPLNGNYAIKINRYQTNYEPFIDGLKNGDVKIFRNKKLAEKGLYQSNLKEKEWLYYNEDGTVRNRAVFENGLGEGLATAYYKGRIVETSTYSKNHLNGWRHQYTYDEPQQLREKAFFVNDRKIQNIRYKKIDSLNFIISDSLFYDDKERLTLKKSFVNDSLLLQYKISYQVVIKDAYNITTTKIEVVDGYNSKITYLLPERDENETEMRMIELLNYEFAYYTDVKKPRLLVSDLTRNTFYTTTFYRLHPDNNLQSVIYDKGGDDTLPGWYYRDIDR
jgi:antitoxin component YwqK of YwqJK toxin-antitoxin module